MKVFLIEYQMVLYTDTTRTTTEVVWKKSVAFESRRHAVRYRLEGRRCGAKPMRIKQWSKRALERWNDEHINQVPLVERYPNEEC